MGLCGKRWLMFSYRVKSLERWHGWWCCPVLSMTHRQICLGTNQNGTAEAHRTGEAGVAVSQDKGASVSCFSSHSWFQFGNFVAFGQWSIEWIRTSGYVTSNRVAFSFFITDCDVGCFESWIQSWKMGGQLKLKRVINQLSPQWRPWV